MPEIPAVNSDRRRLANHVARLIAIFGISVLAHWASAHGDASDYLEHLNKELKENGYQIELLLARAEVHRRQHRYDQSLKDLSQAQSLAPHNVDILYERSLTLHERGDYAEAITAIKQYLEEKPTSPRAYLALAATLEAQSLFLDAARAYDRAIRHQPKPIPDYFIARADSYVAAGHEHLDKALQGLNEAINLLGPLLTLQRLALEVEMRQANHQAALERVDVILQRAERKETWLVEKARILEASGDTEQAHQALLLAIDSIEALPRRIRTTPAMRTLHQTIQQMMEKPSSPN